MTLQYNLSVFLNCPFDDDYLPLFDALAFATICCGFMPRCSFESGSSGTLRMERILKALQSSKYSIHDLTRCTGNGELNLARFNMPLELGVAMGIALEQKDASARHDWLVLVPEGHSYQRFASDLAGFDPAQHSGTIDSIVPPIIGWLATRPEAVKIPTPQEVLTAHPLFESRLAHLRNRWGSTLPWADRIGAALDVAKAAGILG